MDRRVTPPKRVTSPSWGPPPPCKQAPRFFVYCICVIYTWHSHLNDMEIPETKRFIPKWFELGTTLSQPNRSIAAGVIAHTFVFPSLSFWRNCTTFLFVSVKFPSKETLVTASVNAWHPCGNTRKRSGNKSISCFRQHNRIETIAETRVYESGTGVFELFPS